MPTILQIFAGDWLVFVYSLLAAINIFCVLPYLFTSEFNGWVTLVCLAGTGVSLPKIISDGIISFHVRL